MQPGCISLLHGFMQLGCNRISITLRQKQLKILNHGRKTSSFTWPYTQP